MNQGPLRIDGPILINHQLRQHAVGNQKQNDEQGEQTAFASAHFCRLRCNIHLLTRFRETKHIWKSRFQAEPTVFSRR